MKKVILVFAFLFVSNSFLNASDNDKSIYFNDCAMAAWEFGTAYEGSEEYKYYATDMYYEIFCDNHGNYKTYSPFPF